MAKIKVLYVEDEPSLGRIVRESLESRDFEVLMIADGKKAVDSFRESHPDACVLDVMLPGKDGFSIAGEIREIDPKVPILFVTAKVQTEDLVQGFRSGGNDYIRKPFSMEELIVRINNLLKLSRNVADTPSSSIRIRSIEFYPGRYELKVGHDTRKLSHREATLLLMLCETPNSPVLRKNILMKIWGDDSFFNSRNLDVYVSKLRDYLKKETAVEIVTIKGVGYNFVVKE